MAPESDGAAVIEKSPPNQPVPPRPDSPRFTRRASSRGRSMAREPGGTSLRAGSCIALVRLQPEKLIAQETARAHGRAILGAAERARQFGLPVLTVDLGPKLTWEHLPGILSRNRACGAIVLAEDRPPPPPEPTLATLNLVVIGPLPKNHGLPWISTDHMQAMRVALRQLSRWGYRRPALMLRNNHSEETRRRWISAFDSLCQPELGAPPPPPWHIDAEESDFFTNWPKDREPDAVLTTSDRRPSPLGRTRTRARFFPLDTPPEFQAHPGVDQNHEALGVHAVDLLLERLRCPDRKVPLRTLRPACWITPLL